MSPLNLVLADISVIVGSGVLALVLGRAPRAATFIAVVGAAVGSGAGLCAAIVTLGNGGSFEGGSTWFEPGLSSVIGIDPLSAFFLVPLCVLGSLCAVYGRSYLGPRVAAAAEFNLLLAAMTLVLIARHALLFLVAWEVMTLLAYLLVTLEHGEAEVRRAGWVYLITSHVVVLALVALFLVLGARADGALDFDAISEAWHARADGTVGILALAFLGFGTKAGVAALHVWLPEAHAAAPSHVSALMSGVLIKLGVYGLLRTTLLVPTGAGFGVTLLVLGFAGALLGIALALHQRDLKRVLAYSSVENVGIILIGLGLGVWAKARGNAPLAAIGFAGGLLHLWNHAAMKGLLFLGAGSIAHAAGTKDIERLGGLMRRMPWTGRAMFVGALAIAGLPTLNGFMSEWLLFLGFTKVGLRGAEPSALAAIAGASALALIGGLAALCFVRLVGIVLLGSPRGDGAARASESPAAMTLPMALLAVACVVSAFTAPALISGLAPLLDQLKAAAPADVAAAAKALSTVVLVSLALLAAFVLIVGVLARGVRHGEMRETWGCGYAAPTTRMQYTGRAFSEFLTSRILPRWLDARLRVIPVKGLFPSSAAFASEAADPFTRYAYEPFFVRWGNRFARLRILQQGNVHIYIVYILATVVATLTWVAGRDWLAP